ncbi:MAG: response regulator [Armatimonadetes bacterium]|nr:response regulator [Armatimonadota bacterium]
MPLSSFAAETTETLRILHVEDEPTDRLIVSEALRETQHFRSSVVHAETLSEALVAVRGEEFDIVLLDLGLPDSQGLDTFRRLQDSSPELPIIVLTGLEDHSVAMDMVRAGVAEYLSKRHLNGSMLGQFIRFGIERHRMQRALNAQNDRLERRVEEVVNTLKESEFRLSFIADNMGEVFWILDGSQDTESYISPGYEKIWGRDLATSNQKSRHLYAGAHIDDVPAIHQSLLHFEQTGTLDHEFRIVRPDGQVRWIWNKGFRVPIGQGDSFRVAGMAQDITDRKVAEESLASAKTEAERANQAKNEFLSRMSHELRTPLNAVLGYAQLLNLQHGDEETLELVRPILKAGRHLLDLINEVLDIARIEEGRLTVSLEPVDVEDVIKQAVGLAMPLALDAGIELIWSIDAPKHFMILADRQRILQVLINLLSNAVRYNTPEGKVDLRCYPISETLFRFEVTDTGRGISEEDQAKLFVPFERLSNRNHDGVGLGLALSKQLADMMSGRLSLIRSDSSGTAFAVDLLKADEAYVAAEPSTEFESELPRLVRAKVLCIEDNLTNLRLLEQFFAIRKDIEVIPAMQGTMGLTFAREHRPNLIVLDLHLPDISGAEVLEQLKRDEETSSIPVVILSADATQSSRRYLLKMGADRYLTKPIDADELFGVLAELLPSA